MSHGVDAAVNLDNGATSEEAVGLTPREPKPQQLPPAHHSVLSGGERGEALLTWTTLTTTMGV